MRQIKMGWFFKLNKHHSAWVWEILWEINIPDKPESRIGMVGQADIIIYWQKVMNFVLKFPYKAVLSVAFWDNLLVFIYYKIFQIT